MTITVGGTAITFNDGTTQSTAGGTVNTTNVLNATAGASAGAVGSYMMAAPSTNPTTFGATKAGSGLYPTGAFNNIGYVACSAGVGAGAAQSGTWRCMGYTTQYSLFSSATLWLRIS